MPGKEGCSGTIASDEAVAAASHRPDERRLPGVVAQLLTKAADEDVDRSVVGLPVDAPRFLENPFPGEHPPAVPYQQVEQGELRGCEAEGPSFQAG